MLQLSSTVILSSSISHWKNCLVQRVFVPVLADFHHQMSALLAGMFLTAGVVDPTEVCLLRFTLPKSKCYVSMAILCIPLEYVTETAAAVAVCCHKFLM